MNTVETSRNSELVIPEESELMTKELITKDQLTAKPLSMPIKDQLAKLVAGHKRHSSCITVSSSLNSERYAEEPDRLDWNKEIPLTDKHVRIIEVCNKFKPEEAQRHFDHVASNYEGMYLRMGYPDPKYVANFAARFAKRNRWEPKQMKVIDFACGTGLVGQYLSEHGFKHIIGTDVSPNMLEECSNKGVYKELFEHNHGNPEELPQKFRNQFDFVTCAGLINNNHMDYLLFEEMLLSCKKGGFVVFACRFSYMGKYWYDEVIRSMHDDGRWTLLATETFFKYDKLEQVSVGRFSRTPCKVFVFQKMQEEINMHVDKINSQLLNFLKLAAKKKPVKQQ